MQWGQQLHKQDSCNCSVHKDDCVNSSIFHFKVTRFPHVLMNTCATCPVKSFNSQMAVCFGGNELPLTPASRKPALICRQTCQEDHAEEKKHTDTNHTEVKALNSRSVTMGEDSLYIQTTLFFCRQNFTWALSHLKVEGISNNTLLETVNNMLIQSYSPLIPQEYSQLLAINFNRGY